MTLQGTFSRDNRTFITTTDKNMPYRRSENPLTGESEYEYETKKEKADREGAAAIIFFVFIVVAIAFFAFVYLGRFMIEYERNHDPSSSYREMYWHESEWLGAITKAATGIFVFFVVLIPIAGFAVGIFGDNIGAFIVLIGMIYSVYVGFVHSPKLFQPTLLWTNVKPRIKPALPKVLGTLGALLVMLAISTYFFPNKGKLNDSGTKSSQMELPSTRKV